MRLFEQFIDNQVQQPPPNPAENSSNQPPNFNPEACLNRPPESAPPSHFHNQSTGPSQSHQPQNVRCSRLSAFNVLSSGVLPASEPNFENLGFVSDYDQTDHHDRHADDPYRPPWEQAATEVNRVRRNNATGGTNFENPPTSGANNDGGVTLLPLRELIFDDFLGTLVPAENEDEDDGGAEWSGNQAANEQSPGQFGGSAGTSDEINRDTFEEDSVAGAGCDGGGEDSEDIWPFRSLGSGSPAPPRPC